MRKGSAKHITTGFLLVLAAMPLVYILFARVHQQSIRHMMKERLESQILQTVVLPEEEILWVKDGKEILVNGRMFDIRSAYLQNGEYVFTGLYDDDETQLLKQLQNNQQKSNSEDQLLVHLFQFLQSFYHNQQPEFAFCENIDFDKLFAITPSLHSGFLSIFSPPPQV